MQNESSGKKALRAGLGYTIGNILVKGLTFISIPIFARLLSVADYGLYNTFGSYVTIMTFVVGLTLHTSVRNAKLDFPDRIDAFCSSVTIIILLNTALLAVLSVIFAGPLARLLGLEQPYLVVLIIAEGFGLAMITFYNCLLSVDYKYKEYLVLSLLYAVCGLGLSVVLITTVFRGQGYLGRILGTLVPAVLMGIYIIARMFRRARPRVNRGFWVYGLKISLPIVPHGLGQLLLAQFDRIMIKRIIGDTEAGLYSFAYNVGMIFQVITNSLDTAWTPWFFEDGGEGLSVHPPRGQWLYRVCLAGSHCAHADLAGDCHDPRRRKICALALCGDSHCTGDVLLLPLYAAVLDRVLL